MVSAVVLATPRMTWGRMKTMSSVRMMPLLRLPMRSPMRGMGPKRSRVLVVELLW
ncbi:MAG: hypothetical protein BWX86_01751 [Verrucomicrobia bacterium ADurb.Bin122]|nr:MAG: hypothetical protein BWX86_01751 [Verrucomicrobia bacterium ADurb.Bin122]